MKIYPAIDIKDGCCVRLVQGDFNQKTIYNNNPLEVAKLFSSMKAKHLHLVDLDGALQNQKNAILIEQIITESPLLIELGGGIRTLDVARKWLSLGVNRIILGSIALSNFTLIKQLLDEFSADKIVVGIDALDGYVAINGWKTITNIKAIDFAKELKGLGVQYIIYTDIQKDGMMTGPNLAQTKAIIDLGLKVTASGGISTIKDIDDCYEIGCDAVIIGKAYYSGNLDLKQVLERYGD